MEVLTEMSAAIYGFMLVALVLSGCLLVQNSTDSSWSVQIKTSGGLTGRGDGDVSIDSTGRFIYDRPNFPNKPTSQCKATLSPDELKDVKDAVLKAKVAGWKVPGLAIAAPDAFGYELNLHRNKEIAQVEWYDNTSDKLPGDLKTLVGAVSKVREQQVSKCNKN